MEYPGLKIALSFVGFSAAAAAVAYVSGYFTDDYDSNISYTTLAKEANFSSIYRDNTFGKLYKNYFVGTYGKDNSSNKEWFERSFEKYLMNKSDNSFTFSDLFLNITDAFEPLIKEKTVSSVRKNKPTTPKYLNRVCENVYKMQFKAQIHNLSEDSHDKKIEKDAWRYCSNLKKFPLTIKKSEYLSNSNAHVGFSFLGVHTRRNDKLWKWKLEEFIELKITEEESPFFSSIKPSDLKENPLILKDKCALAYTSSSSLTSDKEKSGYQATIGNTVKFCSITPPTRNSHTSQSTVLKAS